VQCTNYESFNQDYGTVSIKNTMEIENTNNKTLDEELISLLNEWDKDETINKPQRRHVRFKFQADETISTKENTKIKSNRLAQYSLLYEFKVDDKLWAAKLKRYETFCKSFETENQNSKIKTNNEKEVSPETSSCTCFSFLTSAFTRNHD
jgi:hypothetical protein